MTGLQPGTVVGDQRYVVIRALSEYGDAEVWTAQDHGTDQLVTLVVLPMSSPTALAVLDAASRSADVDNPRLVRVLDVGREYDYGYFTEESLDGAVSLTQLAGGIGMAAEEVRRITGEVALALDAAQRRGLHHLGLTPDNVLLMPDGSVKLAGLATQAALAGQDHVGGKRALRRDTKGLVALAYAGLTGRWPLGGDVGLPPAPRTGGGVPRPSEIAVGVPADLDTIAALTLNQNLGPVSPGDYAAQIAPWPSLSVRAADALAIPGPGRSDDSLAIPALDAPPPGPDADPESWASVTQALPTSAAGTRWLEAPASPAVADPSLHETMDHYPGAPSPETPSPETPSAAELSSGASETANVPAAYGIPSGAAASAGAAGDITTPDGGAAGPAGEAGGSGLAAGAATTAASAGAAITQAIDSASAATKRLAGQLRTGMGTLGDRARSVTSRAEGAVSEHRDLKAAIRRVEVDSEVGIDQAPQRPTLEPPVPLLPPEAGAQPSRAQSRFVLALFAAFVALAAVIGIAGMTRIGANSDLEAILGPDATAVPSRSASSPPPANTATAGAPEELPIVGAEGYDPEGDQVENSDLAARVYDEDAATFWQSEGYQGPKFGGLKSGVGLVVDLGQDVTPSEITLNLPVSSSAEIYLGDDPDRAGANRVGTVTARQGVVSLPVADGANGRYVIVWFTDTPLVPDGRYRAQLSEISVQG